MKFVEAIERRSMKNKKALEEAILQAIEALNEATVILEEEGEDLLNIEYPLPFSFDELATKLFYILEQL